ncbi:hypothetical protein D9Q98_008552 [Chlorella vulgaris]|uniref:Uncharacterized protein n=1 Tax=Chlorella vulgaris TaxID=3077 RepID=A0A9D4TID8_CHLVU|nr:hypothetical protein D9Q98_008552 [Chlorella vulgaris]
MDVSGKTGVPGAGSGELRAAQWQVEREGDKALQKELKQGDKEAEAMNAARDKDDPTYDPSNPAEEKVEGEM